MDENEEKSLDETLDGVIVQHRADQAYEMKMAGYSLGEIAQTLRYDSIIDVSQALRDRFAIEAKEITSLERDSILALELSRLDKLQQSIWASACYGDVKSVDLALKIISIRAKLTGLDQPDAQVHQTQVLVIGGAEADYVKTLKAAIDPLKELPGGEG